MLPEKALDIDIDVIKPIIEGRNRGKTLSCHSCRGC